MRQIIGQREEGDRSFDQAFAFIDPADRDLVRGKIAEAFAGQGAFSYDVRVRRRDGSAVDLHLQGGVEFGADGRPESIHGVARDITAQRRAEEALRQAEGKYRTLVEHLPAVVYVADVGPTGIWTYVSPQIEAMLGYTAKEWMADPQLWLDALHPDDREVEVENESRLSRREPGCSFATEYRLIARDGRVVSIRDDATLLEDEHGHRSWQGVLLDITAHRQAEHDRERRAAQQAAVARLGVRALRGVDTGRLMREAARSAAGELELPCACVLSIEPGGALVPIAGVGLPAAASERSIDASGATPAGRALRTRGPVIVRDWQRESRFTTPALQRELGARSSLAVPIEGRAGPVGVVEAHAQETGAFEREDVNFVHSLANVLADALERRATEEEIRHRALHDALTGLPNRVLFRERLVHALAQAQRRSDTVAVLFLDLDHFKVINDSLGHQTGDELLTEVGPRLRGALREADTLARLGGDEFAILLEGLDDEREAITVCERIGAAFTRPFVLAGDEHFITASIGIAQALSGEALPDALIRDADAAMYRAKERGRARYELFDTALRARAVERLVIENDLRRALEREELALAYQPVVSLGDGHVIAVEALLRWNHPGRGAVPAADFVPVAEETGLIEPIGHWVLQEACLQTARWQEAAPDGPPMTISVNISARQLAQRDFPEMVARVLRRTRLAPECLALEITERTLIEDAEVPTRTLNSLSELGVRLMLDDFGTGYSSLTYLKRYPLDALKVDRSFVDGLGDRTRDTEIVRTILAMAEALGMAVIAEGVETAEQRDELLRLGCRQAQGYLFSRPVTARKLTALLDAGVLEDARVAV